MKGTFTNIEELEKHLSAKFKGMLKSKELQQAGKEAGRAIGRHVGDAVVDGGKSGYDYDQSGAFHQLISEEGKHGDVAQKQSKLTIGVFELNNMNMGVFSRRNFQTQTHIVGSKGRIVVFRLKQEQQLPKWILAEFGSGRYSQPVPSEFKITYTKRDKPYMYGPSVGPVGGEGGGSKKGYFMVNNKSLLNLLGENRAKDLSSHREHPGIKAGHVFRDGLASSQQEVVEILGRGVQSYLNN
jgi:hypothetical protein